VDALPGGTVRLTVADGESVEETISELRADPRVTYAVPNFVARASAFPNDPGFLLQWTFPGPFGINMPEAWALARRRGGPGGRGAVVAVLDTGVAWNLGPSPRAPDLRSFAQGYDFVDSDRYPLDLNGHGTHVAGPSPRNLSLEVPKLVDSRDIPDVMSAIRRRAVTVWWSRP
jgi:subtilisin family serine protease